MNELRNSLLPVAARVVVPGQCVFAVYLLLRGHNMPGGGFIGGLILASAIVLRAMVQPPDAKRTDPLLMVGIGLLMALMAATMSWLVGEPFFTGLWDGGFWLPAVGKVILGTPLMFDIAVFLVVTGVAAKLLLVLLSQTTNLGGPDNPTR